MVQRRIRRTLCRLAACAILALSVGVAPLPAAAAGEVNSGVEFAPSRDADTWQTASSPENIPWSVQGGLVSPGGSATVLTVAVRKTSDAPQEVVSAVRIDLDRLTSGPGSGERQNPSDILVATRINDEELGESRIGTIFSEDPAFTSPSVRALHAPVMINGPSGTVHEVALSFRLPRETDNSSQGARFSFSLHITPEASVVTPTTEPSASPSHPPSRDTTGAPTSSAPPTAQDDVDRTAPASATPPHASASATPPVVTSGSQHGDVADLARTGAQNDWRVLVASAVALLLVGGVLLGSTRRRS